MNWLSGSAPWRWVASRARRTLAILTSGGDAPGMNAAVRAVVRTALVQAGSLKRDNLSKLHRP